MPVVGNRDDRQESRFEQLLALQGLRRGVERLAFSRGAPRRCRVAVTNAQLARDLQEVIAALDRRLPRLEQAGEASIARDAAVLRAKAVKRLADLAALKALGSRAIAKPSSRGARGG